MLVIGRGLSRYFTERPLLDVGPWTGAEAVEPDDTSRGDVLKQRVPERTVMGGAAGGQRFRDKARLSRALTGTTPPSAT